MGDDIDDYITEAGGWSRFQKRYTWVYLGYPWALCGMQTLLIVFVTMAPKAHRQCKPGLNCNLAPVEFICDLEVVADNVLSSTIAEWDLRCENALWGPLLGSIFFFGFLLGVVFLGRMCDAYGRRKTFYAALTIMSFFSLWGPLIAHSFFWYAVSRCAVGFAVGGLGISSYVLNAEILPANNRSIVLLTSNGFFALGLIMVTLLALVSSSWRALSVLVGFLGMPMFAYAWLPLVESPKWYLTQPNGAALAYDVICHIARVNGVPAPPFKKPIAAVQNEGQQKIVDNSNPYLLLFTHVNLRERTCHMIGAWFACSIGYYGLSMNLSSIGSDIYVSSILSAAVEFPSFVLALGTVSRPRIGRRGTVGISLFAAGIACVACAFIPQGAVLVLALVGKFFMSSAFAVLYLYGAELFPTTLRSTALGVESLAARAAGILAPLVPALDATYHGLPFIIFGLPAMLSGLGVLKRLPETLDRPMPMTVDDVGNSRQADFTAVQNGATAAPMSKPGRDRRLSATDVACMESAENGDLSAASGPLRVGRSLRSLSGDLAFLDEDPEAATAE